MKYMGSKKRLAPAITDYINNIATLENIQHYYEPFMGGCSVGEIVNIKDRNLSDINKYLVALIEKVKDDIWEYKYVEREEWYKIKEQMKEPGKYGYPDWMIGWAIFGCSWRGRPTAFGGKYIDSTTGEEVNPQEQMYNSLLKERNLLEGINFRCCKYNELEIQNNSVIYCDAPYRNTARYDYVEKFNFDEYDEWLIDKSKNNLVLISEYTMMGKQHNMFIELANWELSKGIGAGHTDDESSIERLYYVRDGWLTDKYFNKNDDFEF